MTTIKTLTDIISIKATTNTHIYNFLVSRFKTLYNNYCANGLTPLAQFFLEEYGEIILVEDYSEIENLIFEDVTKMNMVTSHIYLPRYLKRMNFKQAIIFLLVKYKLKPTRYTFLF